MSAARPDRFTPWLAGAVLGLVTLALYWPAVHDNFVNYDDQVYVTSNLEVQKGLNFETLKWAAFSLVSANWHPVTMLSHVLDCQLFGLAPWGHHLTSVLLHTLNTLLVFVWLREMTGTIWRSLLVAAFFGLHPLRVESVAWVAERKDVLSGCFGLFSLIFYVRYARKQQASGGLFESRSAALNYGLAWLFLALGLMSKPMLVTWPLVMLLLDYWPLGRFQSGRLGRLLLEKLPLLGLAVAVAAVTFVVQKHEGAMSDWQRLTFDERAGNALVSYLRYLGKLLYPSDLAVLYPYPGRWPLAVVAAALALLAGISALLWLGRRRQPVLLMGWLWFCGTLVPVLGLVQVGSQAMADRYTYLPSIGLLILAIWGAGELASRWRPLGIPLLAAGLIILLLDAGLTRYQLGFWRDSETLFRHALAVTKDNYYAHNNLGDALYDEGQTDEAIQEFEEAIRIRPAYAEAHHNLGAALDAKGQIGDAIQQYQEALRLKPDAPDMHHSLGVDLIKTGNADDAIFHLRQAVLLKSDDAEGHNDLGNALDLKGQTSAAISEYREAIRLKPESADAHGNLGGALGKEGDVEGAIRELQQAIRLKSDDPLTHYNLGAALHQKGLDNEALPQLQEALRLKPDFAEAQNLVNSLRTKAHLSF